MLATKIRSVLKGAAFAFALLASGPLTAANLIPAVASAPFIVGNDRGGHIVARAREVRTLRSSGRDVRIVGSICYSSCTMLLGLPQTCVMRGTVFGFHGPSRSGRRLDATLFERASRLIAAHYPTPLRDWYLETGRYRTDGLFRLAGSDLIAMGVRAC